MLVISSLRSGPNGRPPSTPSACTPAGQTLRPLQSPIGKKDLALVSPIKQVGEMNRRNSSTMVSEPAWESSIRGPPSPETRCKKLMHIRKGGIPKHRQRGLVPQPIGRSFVTPSELNMASESRNRKVLFDISHFDSQLVRYQKSVKPSSVGGSGKRNHKNNSRPPEAPLLLKISDSYNEDDSDIFDDGI